MHLLSLRVNNRAHLASAVVLTKYFRSSHTQSHHLWKNLLVYLPCTPSCKVQEHAIAIFSISNGVRQGAVLLPILFTFNALMTTCLLIHTHFYF